MRKFLLTISLALCAMTAFAQHIVPGTYSLEKSKKWAWQPMCCNML